LKKKNNKSPILLTLPLPGDKEKKRQNLLFNIFTALETDLSIYNQQMRNV